MKSNKATNEIEAEADNADFEKTDCRTWVQRPMFWRPSYLAPSAWQEHIPFAFWLMHVHRPRVFVELGVHYGVSYFAFCQAVSRLGLDTSCYGIDTFKGDAHSGTYDAGVYEQVRKHNDAQYAGFSSVLRSTFDEARAYFENGSVDLLHIDGMHSFDAVQEDLESWRQKLSPRAVVVLHDTNVRERGFGVAKLFRDLRESYPYFEFIHGHGLGVLGIGRQQRKLMRQLYASSKNTSERQMVREAFSVLGQACAEAYQAKQNEEKAAVLLEQAESRDKQLKYMQQCLEKSKSEVDELNAKLAQQSGAAHAEREKLAHEKGTLEGRMALLDSIRLQLTEELLQRQSRAYGTHAAHEIKLGETEAQPAAQLGNQSKIQELESALGNANLLLEAMREEQQSQAQAAQELKGEHERIRLENCSLEQTNRDLSETIVLFQSENSKLKMELVDISSQLEQSIGTAHETQARSDVLDQELSVAKERVQELEQQLNQEQALSAQLMADLAAAREKVADKERESVTLLEQMRKDADSQIERLDAENNNLRLGLEDARVQLNGVREQLESMASQANSSEEIALLNRKHAEQMKKFSEDIQAYKKQLSERFAELAEMTKMLEEQNAAMKEKDGQLRHMSESMEDLIARYDRAVEEIKAQKTEIEAKTSSLEDRFREIAMLTQIVQQRDAELSSKNEELNLEKERAAHFRDMLEAHTATPLSTEAVSADKPAAEESKPRKTRVRASRLSIDTQISLLDKSEILNKDWYLEQYEDVARSGMSPAEHYVRFGAAEGRQPGPDFDTSWYVMNYPDVVETGVNPAVHYLKYGKKEGRATYSIKRS